MEMVRAQRSVSDEMGRVGDEIAWKGESHDIGVGHLR
jgi:hypothetical protein